MESKFLFIHDNDPGARQKVRKHVSKIMRGRKHQLRSENPFSQAKILYGTQAPRIRHRAGLRNRVVGHRSKKIIPEEADPDVGDRDQRSPTKSHATQSQEMTIHELPLVERSRLRQSTHQSPASISDTYFSAARSDPFGTLPIVLDQESTRCLDHFNTSMPYLEFSIYEGAPLIPSRHLAFRSALETPAALHAIIATGATHLGSLYQVESSHLIQHHIGQALRQLRVDLSNINQSNWSRVAQTMAEMAAGDEFRGQLQSSSVHLNGLRELFGTFGGIEKLRDTPKVQLLTCYVLNASSATYFPTLRCTRGTFNSLREILSYGASSSDLLYATDLTRIGLSKAQRRILHAVSSHVRDFCHFMHTITPPSQTSHNATILNLRATTQRRFTTTTTSNRLLHRLSISTLDQKRFGGLGPKGHHRVSCLFTIVLNLLRLSETSTSSAPLLSYLERLQPLNHLNLRLLQFILMQGFSLSTEEVKMEDDALSWEVVRFMQVYKLLGERWKRGVNEMLVGFLAGDGAGDGISETSREACCSVGEVMGEVLKNLVLVVGEESLVGEGEIGSLQSKV